MSCCFFFLKKWGSLLSNKFYLFFDAFIVQKLLTLIASEDPLAQHLNPKFILCKIFFLKAANHENLLSDDFFASPSQRTIAFCLFFVKRFSSLEYQLDALWHFSHKTRWDFFGFSLFSYICLTKPFIHNEWIWGFHRKVESGKTRVIRWSQWHVIWAFGFCHLHASLEISDGYYVNIMFEKLVSWYILVILCNKTCFETKQIQSSDVTDLCQGWNRYIYKITQKSKKFSASKK